MFNMDRFLKRFSFRYPQVKFFRSSQDPDLERLLDFLQSEGSTSLTEDGEVHIQINDKVCTKSTLLEEMAHAIQFLKNGQVYVPSVEECEREIEAKSCLVERQHILKLTADEVHLSQQHIMYFKERIQALGGSDYQ